MTATTTYSPEMIEAIEALNDLSSANFIVANLERQCDLARNRAETAAALDKSQSTVKLWGAADRLIELLKAERANAVTARSAAEMALSALTSDDRATAIKRASMTGWTSEREDARRAREQSLTTSWH